ncbi:MAG: hypothetical protein JWN86_2119 [Planctomycetota bacterium]|nr:hypothetical protein [Planctomycetota bacterium]
MDTIPIDLRLSGARVGDDPAWPAGRVAAWTRGFLALGALLRVVRYALHHPLWGDEAFLASNLIDRDFADLIRPLHYQQVCPLLFLWAEKAVSLALGFSEFSLRLIPTLSSIAGLFLFRHVAGRLLRGPALVLAVAILAVGFYPIRYGGEIKPYATDFLVALGLLALAIEWLRRPDQVRYLLGLCVLGPIAVGVSHPAIFVAAGVGFSLLVPVAKTRRPAAMAAFACFGIATLAAFLILLRVVTKSQSDNVMDMMKGYWADAFPPRGAAALVTWLATVHTSHMFAYPAGGENGASTLTAGLCLAAIVAYLRRGSKSVLALLLVPFALGLTAAFLGRYPYGGSARTMQYVAPAIGLMAGLGAAVLLARVPRDRLKRHATGLILGSLAIVGLGLLGWDVTHPYKSIYDRECRDFARRFWTDAASGVEIACARTDFGVRLDPTGWRNDRSALYLCYQAIYSPRHRRKEPARLESVAPDRPLRVVVFQERTGDAPGLNAWKAEMSKRFELQSRRVLYANRGVVNRAGIFEDRFVLYEFLPRHVASRRGTEIRR